MSNPPNKLASYRSYSYYHVLAMCDSTNTADLLANSTSQDVWLHADTSAYIDPRPGTEDMGRFNPKVVKDDSGAPIGKYIILINGATDAAYVITQARWTTATAAGAVPGDMNTSIAVEGSVTISEPKGIAFLDQVVKCCIALGVDSSQVVFCLKTFFVGHGFDPTVTTNEIEEQITDIPPLNFITYDVTGTFTEAGGNYEMQFVAAGHGATRLPQYAKAVNSMNITAGDSLQSTLTRLQNNINTNYDKYFKCVEDQIRAIPNADPTQLLNSLRKVRYVIEVGTEYQDTGDRIKYRVSNQSEQYKNTAGCSDSAQITFPTSTSIEGAIRTIMSMSPEVQRESGIGEQPSGIKYEYKIHTGLISRPLDGRDSSNLEYIVFYRVERFMAPKTIAYNDAFAVLSKDDDALRADPAYDAIRRNIIEFDYMYTGKNIDILEFDMKVNMGLAYLQTATLANTFKSQLERAPNRQTQASTTDANTQSVKFGGASTQIPVYFGQQIKIPNLQNTQDANVTIQSAYTMSKHASLEVAEAKMRIVGNTELLRTTNQTTSPEYILKTLNGAGAGRGSAADPRRLDANTPTDVANFQDWSRIPAYAKVNIKMPRNNDDISLFTGTGTDGVDINNVGFADYARDFWFDGYFYVCGIDHIFDNGEFSQTLDMIAIPKRSAFDSTKPANAAPKEIDIAAGAISCYDSNVGCNTASPTGVAQPIDTVSATPPSGNTEPTNRPDAVTILNGKYALSDVTGWDKASPEVQRAIVEAAQKVGVDPIVMAMFAAKESSFRARATAAPASSATGLFQFLKDTWNGLVKQGKATGIVTSPGKQPLPNDPRFDPLNNALAGGYFLASNQKSIGSGEPGDLYLAHFLGAGTAKKVIASDNATGGSQLLSTCLGSKEAAGVAAANPSVVNSQTTVGNLRSWAARSMANMLKGSKTSGTKTTSAPRTTSTQAQVRRVDNQAISNSAAVVPITAQAEQADVRKAEHAIAAQQSCEAQAKKKATDTQPCGPTAQSITNNSNITQGDIRKLDAAKAASSSPTNAINSGTFLI